MINISIRIPPEPDVVKLKIRNYSNDWLIFMRRMIKLKSLLPKYVREAVDLPPPTVSFLTRPAWHSYAKPASDGAGKQYYQGNVDFNSGQSDGNVVTKAANVIKRFENDPKSPRSGFDKNKKRWFPYTDVGGKNLAIAYGHKVEQGEDFSQGVTESEADDLLFRDIQGKINILKVKIKSFDSLPMTVKIAAVSAMFRGDLGPKAMNYLSQNRFDKAAEEYLNSNEYRTTKYAGVKKRMEWIAMVFKGAA
jgi:hypothetical protein